MWRFQRYRRAIVTNSEAIKELYEIHYPCRTPIGRTNGEYELRLRPGKPTVFLAAARAIEEEADGEA